MRRRQLDSAVESWTDTTWNIDALQDTLAFCIMHRRVIDIQTLISPAGPGGF